VSGEREGGRDVELERNVASRTLELELRNAFLRSIASAQSDTVVYTAAAKAIGELISADAVVIAYYDGLSTPYAAVYCGGGTRIEPLGAEDTARLERAASERRDDALAARDCARYSAVFRLESHDEVCGYLAVGRDAAPLGESERAFLKKTFSNFAHQARMRKQYSRDEHIRREAEQALRKSEERLRTFFAESKDMIYTANADDVIASINGAGLKLLGIDDRFEAIGRPFADHVMSPEDRQNFLRRIGNQGFVIDYEYVLRRRDGKTVFCIESAHAVKDAAGAIVEIQGIVKDISERIASERELWKANLELAEANENLKQTRLIAVQQEKLASIGQLAAGIAHEINNPLGFLNSNHSIMTAFLDKLRAAWEEASALCPDELSRIADSHDLGFVLEELGNVVAESDEGFRRIIDIVQNLRSFSRIETSPVMSLYNVNEGIKSTLVVARNEVKYVADIELDLGDLPTISALGGEINQVFLNVIVNAAHAIASQKRKEKGKILISSRLDKESAIVVVDDDGPGIPDENKLKIFDPFFTTKAPGKGTGLGLAISYDIVVRKHQGALSVSDSPQGGARFRVQLPIQSAASEG